MSNEADPLQLSMIGINPCYRLSLAEPIRFPDARRLDRSNRSQRGHGAVHHCPREAEGVKTLNVVRREEAAEQVRQWGGNRVVLQEDNLHKDIEKALDGKKLSLVLDTVGGAAVGELAKSLKPGGSVVVYGLQSGQFPAMPPKEFIYRGLSLHGFWLINWIRTRRAQRSKRYTRSCGTSELMDRSPPQWSMCTRSTSSRKHSGNL